MPVTKIKKLFDPNVSVVDFDEPEFSMFGRMVPRRKVKKDWSEILMQISATLPIAVYIEHESGTQMVNLPNWKSASQDDFLEFLERLFGPFRGLTKKFSRAECAIEHEGAVIGRAFLVSEGSPGLGVYDRGIYVGADFNLRACGLIEGTSDNAARDRIVMHDLSKNDAWFRKEMDYAFRIAENIGEVLACQDALLKFGRFNENAILFAIDRTFVSFVDLVEKLRGKAMVRIALEQTYTEPARWRFEAETNIRIITGSYVSADDIYALVTIPESIDEREDLRKYRDSDCGTPFGKIVHAIFAALGEKGRLKRSFSQERHSLRREMILEFSKS
jgi:hypothetical protein